MRSVANDLRHMPIFGLIVQAVAYLLTIIIATLIITWLVGLVVTEYGRAIAPSGHVLVNKAALTLAK